MPLLHSFYRLTIIIIIFFIPPVVKIPGVRSRLFGAIIIIIIIIIII